MLEKTLEREGQQYLAEGEARGIAKAKAEKDKEIALRNKEITLRLLADKVDINIIVNATGLSVDEIMALHDTKDS